jgi:hypothetical protein
VLAKIKLEASKMSEIPLNVIEFIEHPGLLNDRSLSAMQRVILKSVYGLPLSESELELYYAGTGRERYDATEQIEATIIAGRRSGKTSKIAALIVIYEAFRDHGLPQGEEAFVLLIAPHLYQAKIAFRCIRRYLHQSRILSKRIVRETQDQIALDNGVVIACYPASLIAVRGVTIIATVCDEMAFWPHESSAANPEQEILDALQPGMANVARSKLIKISTPFSKQGVLYMEFQRRAELGYPVFQVPTSLMNPTIKASELERYRKKDEQKYRREFDAEFTEDLTAWIDPEMLDRCVVRGRKELPSIRNVSYAAAIDPAFSHDDFVLIISHMLPNGTIVVDLVIRWRGTKRTPVNLDVISHEIKMHLDRYGIFELVGDQHCYEVIRQQFLKLGIEYRQCRFGSHTRAEIFGNLKHLVIQRKIELPDNPELLEQLRSLEERTRDGGRIDFQAPGKMRDDFAVVLAVNCHDLSAREGILPAPQLGVVEFSRNIPSFIPISCPVAAICRNFPNCIDYGSCQGFDDERLVSLSRHSSADKVDAFCEVRKG